jgi:small subunit ribosomal protein S4e
MKSHLKRLAMPKTWDIKRKSTKYVLRPLPGSHTIDSSIPLQTVLRDVLKVAKTAKEVRYILNEKSVLVNGKKRFEVKYPVGLMDVIEIPELKKSYRILFNLKGKIYTQELKSTEKDLVPYKIQNKSHLKKGKIQLNFTDGSNLLVDKDTYKTDDVVLFDLSKKKIVKHIEFKKGSLVYLTGGNCVGDNGKIEDIKEDNIIVKSSKGKVFETSKKYSFALGKSKLNITLPE